MADLLAADRGHSDRPLGHRRKPREAGEQHVAQGAREPAAGDFGVGEFLGEQRVAAGAVVDLVTLRGLERLAQGRFGQFGGLRAGEPTELDPVDAAEAFQFDQEPAELVVWAQPVGPVGGHDEHAGVPEAAGPDAEQLAGGAVGPVQVLDDHDDRPLLAEPLHHRGEELEELSLAGRLRASVRAGGKVVEFGQQPRRCCRRQQLQQLLGADLLQQVAQHGRDRCQRQTFLPKGDARAGEHTHAGSRGLGGEPLDQGGLADPGLTADHRHPWRSRIGALKQAGQPRTLGGSSDEP